MAKLELKYLPPSKLKMTKYNPRIHPDAAIEKLAHGIEHYGFINPVIIEKGTNRILAGHARLKASLKQNLKEIPVIEVDLHGADADGYMIFDNQIQDKTEWDYPILKDILEELDTGAFDMDLTGFEDVEIEELMNQFHIGWNPEKTEDAADGDGINDLIGYGLQSFWKNISNENAECFKYQIDLPLQNIENNLVRQKYSRTNLEEIQRIILTYMRNGDYFLENCCGWSTFGSSAKYFGYSGIGIDIWDKAINHSKKQIAKMPGKGKVEIKKMDGMDLKFKDKTFDFVYCNPPFMDQEKYSGLENDIADNDFESFGFKFTKLMQENYRVLKNDKLCVITINDKREKGFLIPIQKYVIEWGEMAGFKLWDFVVAEILSQKIRLRKKDYELRRTVKCHEYVIVFKKI